MTTTRQHIEDLDVDTWAALTRRAAVDAVDAAKRHGLQPPAELVAVAAMTPQQLAERRRRSGPAAQRLSPVMQLVDADHQRRLAEGRARDAHQGRLDAETAAQVARAEADESARAATAARERARAADADSARKEAEHRAERASDRHALQEVRAELDRVKADAAAKVGEAEEQVKAARAFAEQMVADRTAAAAAGEHAVQQLRAELNRVKADAASQITGAEEQIKAATAFAEQMVADRTAAVAAGQQAVEQVRAELERVRADAAAEVAAVRAHASGEVAAAREAADAEVARARAAAEDYFRRADGEIAAARQATAAEVARARADAQTARQHAEAAINQAASTRLVTIPLPPLEVRAGTRRIENALTTLHQIDYMLEIGMLDAAEPPTTGDVELIRRLVWTVQQDAEDLSAELGSVSARYDSQQHAEAAAGYAKAAALANRQFLQRIETATQQLQNRNRRADAEIIELVTIMLADLRDRNYY